MDEKLRRLTSTQRLPLLGKMPQGKRAVLCRGCDKELFIPESLKSGHVRCRFCGELHRVGIPPQYARIPCGCGRILTAPKKFAGLKGRCPGCRKVWKIPGAKSAPVAISRPPGIPPEYVRIPCGCGRILTAPRKAAGQKGRCRNCGCVFTVGEKAPLIPKEEVIPPENIREPAAAAEVLTPTAPLPLIPKPLKTEEAGDFPTLDILAPLAEAIRFKCTCGQPHLVEGERSEATILCFRCKREVKVPASPTLESTVFAKADGWCVQTPYHREDLFALLNVAPMASISDIKQACRSLQSQIRREDPLFQKVQIAKDTLCKPESRLWYEVAGDNLWHLWKGMGKPRCLKLHDRTVALHKQAIEIERQRLYSRADPLWQRAIAGWLTLVQSPSFKSALKERGNHLFAAKFQPEIAETLCRRALDEVVSVGCQFRERYIAEENVLRADRHLEILAPLLKYRWDTDPADIHNKRLLTTYLIDEVHSLAQRSRWKKILPLLSQLKSLASGNEEVQSFLVEIFSLAASFIGKSQRLRMARDLEIREA